MIILTPLHLLQRGHFSLEEDLKNDVKVRAWLWITNLEIFIYINAIILKANNITNF
jgi:hypothetical protein